MELMIKPSPTQAPWLPKILYTILIILALYGTQFFGALWQIREILATSVDFVSEQEVLQYIDFPIIILYTAAITCTIMFFVFYRYERNYQLDERIYSFSCFIKNALCHFCGLFIVLYAVSLVFGLETTANNEFIKHSIHNHVIAFIAIVLAAPIMEELFFRRWIMGYLGNYSWLSIIISTILFAASHLSGDICEFLLYLIAGFYFGWLYRTFRNIKLNILVHVFNNLLGFSAIFLQLGN